PRYTEATLVGVMEKEGIGRPSTYAPTLDTIQRRGYVTLEERRFVPTEIGETVSDLLVEYFPEITDVNFTVKMESDLDEIEVHKEDCVNVIDQLYQRFSKRLEQAQEETEDVEVKDETVRIGCEECDSPMIYQMGRYGRFMACSNL